MRTETAELESFASSEAATARRRFEEAAAARRGRVSDALRAMLRSQGKTAEALFSELSGAGHAVPAARFAQLLDQLGLDLNPEQRASLVDLGDDGLSRAGFLALAERYCRCAKDVAITKDFEIKASGTLRKLRSGEVLEVLEGPKVDVALGLSRVLARALSDNVEGWVTSRGNQGTAFLVEAPKPQLLVAEPSPLQSGLASEGATELRTLEADEVLEVLEGPRKDDLGSATRARGKALSDGAVGWFTVRSRQGELCAEPGRTVLRIVQGIALTDVADIRLCKVLKRLEKGESVEVLDGPSGVAEDNAGLTRVRVRALKDSLEGWLTTRGNAGSSYAEEGNRHYVMLRGVPLQPGFRSDASASVRDLEEGEQVEVLEGPREERPDPVSRVRVRAVSDGASGWVTVGSANLRPWAPVYRSVADAELAGRRLGIGERLEVLEGPRREADSGLLRVKVRAAQDGAVGWLPVVESGGERLLEAVPPKMS